MTINYILGMPSTRCLVNKVVCVLLFFTFSLPAMASTGEKPNMRSHDITLDQAFSVLTAARQEAERLGSLMDIAIVDSGANLKAFIRMDEAFLGSIDVAIKKAKTARFFNMPTGKLGALSQPGQPLYGVEFSNDGLITFGGGIPLKNHEGTIIGAIGVSGSSVDNDQAVATAGAAVLK